MSFVDQAWNAHAQEAPNIIIEEIAWAGSNFSIADEWIELANLGNATATIGGYALHDVVDPDRIITIPDGAEIPPFGTYLIANYAETDMKSALMTPVQLVTTSVSLSNSKLGLELRNALGTPIDRAGNGETPSAGSSGSFASMIRTNATSSGDQADSWIAATTSSNWKVDILNKGTPGVCDLCEAPSPTGSTISTEEVSASVNTSTASEIVATSTDPVAQEATSTPAMSETAISTTTTPSVTEIVIPRAYVTFSEIVSNPLSGKEWIELRFNEGITMTDRTLHIYDAKGRIATIATSTPLTIAPYLIISLSSAKLNNGGESISLREGDTNAIIETTSVPELEKGQSWAKHPETDSWKQTETITPAAENIIYTTPPKTASSSSPVSTAPITSVATSTSTTQTTATSSTSVAVTLTNSSATRIVVRLSETVSNPSSGPEWVELLFADGTTSTDRELILKDGQGIIARIPARTMLTASPYLLVPLTSARLNNSGDALTLAETDGIVLDATEIPALTKNESWAKHPSAHTWHVTTMLTPGTQNTFDTDISDTEMQMSTNESEISSDAVDEIMSAAESLTTETVASSKSSSSKKSDVITPHPFADMFDTSLNSSRVRVSGTVGSVHRLFGSSHVFVLLAEDGRGLLVYLPKHLNVPPMGSSVQVNGTLSSTYQGPELRMKTTDVWMTVPTSTPPTPRIVDLLAPGSEDAWSLVTIEGTVQTVTASALTIETADGIVVTTSVPSAANVRTKRFQKDDRMQITALLNIRKETPTVVIRSPDDITLLSHAEGTVTLPSAQKSNGLPDWIPFVAAGGAVLATGTSKRVREYVKKKKLQKMVKP